MPALNWRGRDISVALGDATLSQRSRGSSPVGAVFNSDSVPYLCVDSVALFSHCAYATRLAGRLALHLFRERSPLQCYPRRSPPLNVFTPSKMYHTPETSVNNPAAYIGQSIGGYWIFSRIQPIVTI